MLRTTREWLVIGLVALLPFHALLVTVITRVIMGPDHPPMSEVALWKEALLGVVLLIALAELVIKQRKPAFDVLDVLDWLVLALLVLSLAVTAFTHANWGLYAFGFRYDFIPLIAFLILRRVEWSNGFGSLLAKTVLASALIVASYALLTIILPNEFFRAIGYSDLHSLYIPGRPIAAFQLIGDTGLHRLQGPMSGPNQFGLWLLLPFGIALKRSRFALAELFAVAIFLSFSRAAWIGAAILIGITAWPRIRALPKHVTLGSAALVIVLCIVAAQLFPSVILRVQSSEGHLKNPIMAIQRMIDHPLGEGLGTAGPASNRVSNACVYLKEGEDASWAAPHKDLCVFVGDTQVQPVVGACNCPFLPENWYLQIGVEMGWIGFALYLTLIGFVLWHTRKTLPVFIAVSVAALFLHAFEDAALAYTLWIMLAILLPPLPRARS